MPVALPSEFLQKIRLQAEKDYPHETCGILTGPVDELGKVADIFPCRNIQDEYHAQDPVSFPRTSQTAYFIDPRELLRIQRTAREKKCEMRVIYHSHVDAGAYFSEEDKRVAASDGMPCYPGVSYLVASVKQQKVEDYKIFFWDEGQKDFMPGEINLV